MNSRCRFVQLLVLASILSGCATADRRPDNVTETQVTPVDELSTEAPSAGAAELEPMPAQAPHAPGGGLERPQGPAGFLLEQAERQRTGGKLTAAAMSVERAMRIRPGNAWLSLKLGEIRLDQGNAVQAETLAQRALAQAGGSPQVRRESWALAAAAREAQGDKAGAAEARANALSESLPLAGQ